MKSLVHHLWDTDFDALRLKLTSIAQFFTFVVTAFSVAANVLPKYEQMTHSKARASWKFITKIVALLALNWRRHLPGMNWHIGAMKNDPKEGTNSHDNLA